MQIQEILAWLETTTRGAYSGYSRQGFLKDLRSYQIQTASFLLPADTRHMLLGIESGDWEEVGVIGLIVYEDYCRCKEVITLPAQVRLFWGLSYDNPWQLQGECARTFGRSQLADVYDEVAGIFLESSPERAEDYYSLELLSTFKKAELRGTALEFIIRRRFIEDPVLTLPVFEKCHVEVDMNDVHPLDESTIFYGWFNVSAEWGVIEANGGDLIWEKGQVTRVVVSAPSVSHEKSECSGGTTFSGDDWKLELKAGFRIAPGSRPDDECVIRE